MLNPVHDRMTRFEMRKKRAFLSRQKRTVISVWNKGKKFRNSKTNRPRVRAELTAPWTIYRTGKEQIVEVDDRSKLLSVEFAIIDLD